MPYNEQLADRIRGIVGNLTGLTEQKMFGGIAFMLNGNMFCGISRDDFMARVGPEHFEETLSRPGARQMDMAGRPMKGMIGVAPEGYATDQQLRGWVEQTLEFVRTLPAKKPKRR
ncbi:MAG: TfoX/Sxy family protein [Chloroflexi bacterium]|nr:MAG: TfoX/Sxy family protein [Chloroflexota bacterium]TMG06782.1 MAG: TfoX/Sxy family protein [Chloroflexota bacterium]